MTVPIPQRQVDFDNTENAFAAKSDKSLKKAYWLFKMMNSPFLVKVGSNLTLLGLKLRLPIKPMIRWTIFDHFCGGTTLLETKKTVNALGTFRIKTILDYGAERKTTEEDFNQTMRETLRAIQFAEDNTKIPFVSIKVSGLTSLALLEKVQEGTSLTQAEHEAYDAAIKRLDSVCHHAKEHGTGVFIDAEESWIQDTIDHLAEMMMKRYNTKAPVVYTTLQMYRHDRLAFLKNSITIAEKEGYIFATKIVRGAYMDKERERAAEKGYKDPIQPNKAATDRDYNLAMQYCVERFEKIAFCNATHNMDSCRLQVELMNKLGIPANHPNLMFSQLLGMSDHLTYNLQKAGFNTSKYVPYGPVEEVIPYLVRRAEENTSVTGDMSRELALLKKERQRRKI